MLSSNFLEHGKTCPICNKKLSLYAIVGEIGTFKCNNNYVANKKRKLNFYPLRDKMFLLHSSVNKTDNFVIKLMDDNKFDFTFSSENLFKTIIKSNISFFYICNLSSFYNETSYSINSYNVDGFNACYYKLSSILSFNYKDDNLTLTNYNSSSCHLEMFSLLEDNNKYSLIYNYGTQKTLFYFNDSKENNIEPSFFKEFDILEYYPDFTNHSKVLNKFKSWVLLS